MLNPEQLTSIKETLTFIDQFDLSDQRLLMTTVSQATFDKGEIIMNKEKECNGLVLVRSGQLRAFFELEDGKEITLYRLLPRDVCILSASCVIKNINFEVTLEAEKNSAVYFLPAQIWSRLAEKYSAVKEFSMELVSERFSEVMWVMEQMVSKNMGERIAAFLLDQSVLEESQTLSMTHEAIAKNLGTAREVISRTLKYLENDGLIKLSRGQIELVDIKKLREMSR